MARNTNHASRKFHDRIAKQYDTIYDDPYWEFHDRITWHHLKNFLPKDLHAPVMDLGCGTGKWGLKLLKAGYPTTFADLSVNMLTEVQQKLDEWKARPDLVSKASKATIKETDAVDLRAFPADHFELITAMGDVFSICSDPPRCATEVHRILRPGGVFVFTVDNQLAAIDHFVEKGKLDALVGFARTGKTEWLTSDKSEQFDLTMFTPASIEALVRRSGFEVISRIGKTIIPARRNKKLFEEPGSIEQLVDAELLLARDPASAARASHLQLAVRKNG